MDYAPEVFDVDDIASAKRIILVPEGGTTDGRWAAETPYLVDLCDRLELGPRSMVLDYGCGIGRLAREIIRRTGCRVVGADLSARMRALAAAYVDSDHFFACHPKMLPRLGVRFDAALAIWVLQHCEDPFIDLRLIRDALSFGGRLLVLNEHRRCIPMDGGRRWVDDGIDIQAVLDLAFIPGEVGVLPVEVVPTQELSHRSFWKFYRAKGD